LFVFLEIIVFRNFLVSPNHSIKLGFLDEEDVDQRYQLNYLMYLALQKVAFIPFSFVMDKYRYLLFRQEIDPDYELNSMWWALRVQHGGIMAAVPRSEKVNFDPGAKYHIIANVPYFRYFIAHFLEFQFYRALCRLQGQTTQLHMCDIYGNKEVGARFKQMLALGNSKPWEEVLYSLTGETKLESQAVLDFFKPLHVWLKKENAKQGYPVGWM
jgi:peptidyl-dipeptidase A